MMVIETGEKPTNMLTWKPTIFISHIMTRSHDDRFPVPLWETWFCSSLGVPIANPRQCPCRQFSFDPYGDHIQTCQSPALPVDEWIVYKLGLLFRSVGHRFKTHKFTLATFNEHGDIEIKHYVILPNGEDNRIPPHTLMMDVTVTHDRHGRTTQCTNGTLTHRVSSTGVPHPDNVLNNVVRIKLRHYLKLYSDKPDPIVFLSVSVSTLGLVYDDFVRLLFYHAASILTGELPE